MKNELNNKLVFGISMPLILFYVALGFPRKNFFGTEKNTDLITNVFKQLLSLIFTTLVVYNYGEILTKEVSQFFFTGFLAAWFFLTFGALSQSHQKVGIVLTWCMLSLLQISFWGFMYNMYKEQGEINPEFWIGITVLFQISLLFFDSLDILKIGLEPKQAKMADKINEGSIRVEMDQE